MDNQREFYEIGYGGGPTDGALIAQSFSDLAPHTRIARAVDLLAGSSGTLLDVGCGGGPLLFHVRRRFSLLQGVDIAEAQLQRARAWAEATGTALELHRCNFDTEPLPFAPASADAVACLVVLEFLMWPERAMAQISALIKPGGILVVSVGNIVSGKNRLRTLVGSIPRTSDFQGAINGGALHFFSRESLVALLTRHGLSIERVSCSGRCWQIKQAWPSLLAGDIMILARKY